MFVFAKWLMFIVMFVLLCWFATEGYTQDGLDGMPPPPPVEFGEVSKP